MLTASTGTGVTAGSPASAPPEAGSGSSDSVPPAAVTTAVQIAVRLLRAGTVSGCCAPAVSPMPDQ